MVLIWTNAFTIRILFEVLLYPTQTLPLASLCKGSEVKEFWLVWQLRTCVVFPSWELLLAFLHSSQYPGENVVWVTLRRNSFSPQRWHTYNNNTVQSEGSNPWQHRVCSHCRGNDIKCERETSVWFITFLICQTLLSDASALALLLLVLSCLQ